MEWVRSTITALLLFLTLLVLVASGDDAAAAAAAAAAAVDEHCHPLGDDEPYHLVTFQHKDGEEIRVLADQRSGQVSGFANRSGHWFYANRYGREDGNGNKRGLIPRLPESRGGGSRTEGLWNTLGALANTTAASDPAPDDDERCYMLVDMQTGGGDKNRLVVVVVPNQRYLSVTGFAQGFSSRPNWFFREGLDLPLGNDVWSSHSCGSHAEAVVVSNLLLGALMKGGASC